MRKLLAIAVLCACATFSATATNSLQQLAELTPTTRANQDSFGISVAISGDTAVVSDYDANIESFGSIYVYVKPASGWDNMTQTARLTASDSGQGFGTSVAIDGNIIVVGAANTSNFSRATATPGAVYVYVKPAGGWQDMTETAKLTATDGLSGDAFGNSVSISGTTIAIGAFFVNNFSGRAYVFTHNGGGWKQAAELTASDSDGILDYLGCSVAISGDTVVAGSFGHTNFQGASYVFVEPSGGWSNMTETAELSASNGAQSDNLGFSVGINGSVIVAGAPGARSSFGGAYVYLQPTGGWSTTSSFAAELGAPNGLSGDSFGQAVSIGHSGRVIVVGAPGLNVGSNDEEGAAYVYSEPKAGWGKVRSTVELTASDGTSLIFFGVSVGISNSSIIAGAPGDTAPGAAYIFGP